MSVRLQENQKLFNQKNKYQISIGERWQRMHWRKVRSEAKVF